MITDPVLVGQAIIQGLLEGAVYALVALGLALTLAVTKLLNFAHGALLMVAMYVVYMLTRQGLHPYVTALVVVPLFFGLGWLSYRAVLRRVTETSFLMQAQLTLGFLFLLEGAAVMVAGVDPRRAAGADLAGSVVRMGDFIVPVPQAVTAAVAVVASLGLYVVMGYSKFGRSLRAVSEDAFAASLCGVRVKRMFAVTWAIGFGFLALAAPLVMMSATVHPYVGNHYIVVMLLAIVLGGLGDLGGALLGALLVGVSTALGQALLGSGLALVPAYLVVVLVLVLRPRGLLGAGVPL